MIQTPFVPLRLLSWCHPRGIVPRSRHIPGRLNVQAFQTQPSDQTEWSLSQVFDIWCSRWARPHVELFATRFNHKLPKFVSPVPDPTAWAVDALSPPWENLDVYTFPPVSLLGHMISKVMDQGYHKNGSDCSRVVQHDLVLGSGQFCRFRSLSGFLYKGSGNTAL